MTEFAGRLASQTLWVIVFSAILSRSAIVPILQLVNGE
ncbi:hypothetical protein GAGA_0355 [Paraglaciecola agarilytica NO2]|uniref:Uncharacterized protein n=1 Tax=Paraglaciecola agarilytica NO2 TaxID=1125747 RepID=A0ABQ0I1M8_9ALTE|nr:hypothetical protein GAGA_0355 [Paraglaciecola agarilytica NO2]